MKGRAAGVLVLGPAAGMVLATLLVAGCLPIAPGVGELFVPRFVGEAAQAKPGAAYDVPQHPYMAANGRNSMHNDPYATDAYATPGPLGRNPQVSSATFGISECATLTFDRKGRVVGLCGGVAGPEIKVMDPDSLAVLANHALPKRILREGVSPLEDLCGGAYFYLDNEDRPVVATTNRQVHIINQPVSDGLFKTYELSSLVPDNDCLIALMPDWSGRIWFVTAGGRVGNTEGYVHALQGERIANSFAVDETGGVFVVTDHALYRFDSAGVTWRQAYERGSRKKPGQLSHGSGTTPTLFGSGRWVGITDNAEPRMNVLVYERANGKFVCGEPVFEPGASATDNSLVAVGDSLLVENNYGYRGPASTLFGNTSSPGIARVDVNKGKCSTAWTSDEIAPSSVPKVSLANGLMYVYAKPHSGRVAAWYLAAIDIHTGRTVFRILTGTGWQWNNHYAAITLAPDGSAYVATLTGLVRVKDEPGD